MMKNETKQTNEVLDKDQTVYGGQYHGPSNQAGLTVQEYYEVRDMWEDEMRRRDDWV